MTTEVYPVKLIKVALEVPLIPNALEVKDHLVVTIFPVKAQERGKMLLTSEGKRIPSSSLLQLKSFSGNVMPLYYVVCTPDDQAKAVSLIHEAAINFIRPLADYYRAMSIASQKPPRVLTDEEFLSEQRAAAKTRLKTQLAQDPESLF